MPGTALGPELRVCSTTPRFSYDGSETVICTCPSDPYTVSGTPSTAVQGGCTRVGYGDWVGGGRGYTGYYPATVKRSRSSEAGPGSPSRGLEWVGSA